jgi:hypothetical protein
MSGAVPPLLQYAFMVWCLVKNRDNFTFKDYVLFQYLQDKFESPRITSVRRIGTVDQMQGIFRLITEFTGRGICDSVCVCVCVCVCVILCLIGIWNVSE